MKTFSKFKLLFFFLALLPLLNTACPRKHPADIVAPPIIKGTEGYLALQDRLADARRAGLFNNTQWNQIDKISDKADIKLKEIHQLWYQLSKVNVDPESSKELQDLIIQLQAFALQLKQFFDN